ncbi:hypothetical protein RRG08_018196 [Elysia crispata]|uniref:Uncharacterized protein n=1 Tax=Elysia crispata TaxID=231223 RepID=A0AAE0YJZ4_9GAST|nr:hypothetical protein RRG08_018196 [Elysia crispata]
MWMESFGMQYNDCETKWAGGHVLPTENIVQPCRSNDEILLELFCCLFPHSKKGVSEILVRAVADSQMIFVFTRSGWYEVLQTVVEVTEQSCVSTEHGRHMY